MYTFLGKIAVICIVQLAVLMAFDALDLKLDMLSVVTGYLLGHALAPIKLFP